MKPDKTISRDEWVSEIAVNTAIACLRHFYPTDTKQIAEQALEAAEPHLVDIKRGTPKKPSVIPNVAIEKAAESIYSSCITIPEWEAADPRYQKTFMEEARTLLQAIALRLQP